ncbi:MAG: RecQ family ATP-dependent DNA helicase [Gammaproteobacteria bacterium]|nr:RecQ family ATP-dependent DNA helicase [Gammaproteobacteria bacterium]
MDNTQPSQQYLTQALQHYFGFEQFRTGQLQVVNSLYSGRSAAAIFPTGSGKSLCYQLPAMLLPNVTLVISPLLALIQDQVAFLNNKGITAASIDSSQSRDDANHVMAGVQRGEIKILMVSVERLKNERFRNFIQQIPISMMVIDEAHCISEWGHNFRPDYLKLPQYQKQFNIPQVLLLTATATPQVIDDMQKKFAIAKQDITVTGFYRDNLHLAVEGVSDRNKLTYLQQWLFHEARYKPKFFGDPTTSQQVSRNKKDRTAEIASTIIYVTLQQTAEEVAQALNQVGFNVAAYHAGMDSEKRQLIQTDFMAGNIDIIVATIAFGMGIDKSNIRHVVHYDLPKSIENYSQEVGRAGRDGEPSDCLVLFNRDSLPVLENFVYGDTPELSGVEYVLNDINENTENGQWQCQIYSLSNASNIRQLPLKTLLVYLEMQGLIQPLYAYFAEYKFKLAIDSIELINHFNGERQQFVQAILNHSTAAKTWWTVDIDNICQNYDLDVIEGRRRIIAALEYFEQQGWLELQNKQMTEVYRVNVNEINLAKQAKQITDYFVEKQQSEIARIHNMLALFEREQCLSFQLASYFGDGSYGDNQAPLHCGHCSVCRGHKVSMAAPIPPSIMASEVNALSETFIESYRQLFARAPSLVAITRFLCGISTPEFVKLKARKIAGFGALEKVSYRQVLSLVSGR